MFQRRTSLRVILIEIASREGRIDQKKQDSMNSLIYGSFWQKMKNQGPPKSTNSLILLGGLFQKTYWLSFFLIHKNERVSRKGQVLEYHDSLSASKDPSSWMGLLEQGLIS